MMPEHKGKPDTDTSITQDAKETAASVSDATKEQAQNLARSVASDAQTYAGQAKVSAADEVKDVASALRTAADELRSGSPQERTFSQIADSLADASDAVRDKDLGEMVGAVNDFARRNPMIFLGSAALIGFAATRFAKASGDRSPRSGGTPSGYRDRQSSPAPTTQATGHGGPSAPAGTTPVKGGTV
ncbi:hypothetical protein [Maritimibacter sp. DP1N21-5]|uniref:hypothetical protein n=1 Tax=Maritimibacter sp. DP1N21-5 TaxID=2836867 RepID=UPI001C45E2DF|nr:hypothetical protein [Maritimibacter sp. DP1N21-5]MBV7411089.1 hypothetical protein [Maritimibacter sp. DP1N21-5]